MLNRKSFLVLALICIAPLLILALILFLTNTNTARKALQHDLEQDLAASTQSFNALLAQRDQERLMLAGSPSIVDFLRKQPNPGTQSEQNGGGQIVKAAAATSDSPEYLRDFLSAVLAAEKSYAAIACFNSSKQLLFVAEQSPPDSGGPIVLRTKDFLQQEWQPDAKTWTAKEQESVCELIGNSSTGRTWRCATPVYSQHGMAGAVVTDVKLHELISEVAQHPEVDAHNGPGGTASRLVVVLDKSGEIVYHTNHALRHQRVDTSFADFAAVAAPMTAGEKGSMTFDSAGDQWLAVYSPLQPAALSLAIASNVSREIAETRQWGWLGFGLAIVLGLGVAAILNTRFQKDSRGIERVTEDVAAIAKGDLDLEVDARSRDNMRPLADGVNLVTKRLREQIAHESETRQFQSFVRLSAMLTHDLKNAIGGLSLLVSNMEAHYANEEFRADAMKSLTGATEKLKSLVDRISNPITTLSGEYKLSQPVDLVPIIRRVVPQTIGRVSGSHQLEMDLPPTLVALVDGERIEKVIENLVLNGLEAMHRNTGTLRIEGGKEPDEKVFLKISDTGVGMSERFMDEKLFHAFATTKKSGMGLGLYTCREVVMANGGTIEVTSKQGDGTTFRVVLPSPPSNQPE